MIRGKTRFLGVGEDTPPSGVGIEASIHNKFEIEVKDVVTGEIRQIGKAENIILDQYWMAPGIHSPMTGDRFSPGHFIAFGTGTGSIAPDRTTMFNLLGKKTVKNDSKTVQNNRIEKYSVFSGEIELLPSEYVGAELTEVGLLGGNRPRYGSDWFDGFLMTHALFKDANNNPISIVKTSTDLITIKASVYLHYPNTNLKTTHLSYTVPIVGYENDNDLIRAWDGSILPNPRFPLLTRGYHNISLGPGMPTLNPSNTDITFDGTSKKSTIVFPRAETAAQNTWPITAFMIGNRYIQLIPEELYSDITNEVVGVGDGIKTGFSTYFPFPMNAVVKMDGVVAPDATIHQSYGTSFPTLAICSFIQRIFSDGDLAYHFGSIYSDRIPLSNVQWSAGGSFIYKNIFPEQGIYRIRGLDTRVEKFISDDLEDWISLGTAATVNIPDEYQNFRFFKFTALNDFTTSFTVFFDTNRTDNIIFNTPPPEGAVIEVDYTFPGIAKDENHVLDMELEVSFGEHEE